jgi:hypothetical protein
MARTATGEVHSNFGRCRFGGGWWWGVWQGWRLVGFGAGYRSKARCFKHERQCKSRAEQGEMQTAPCENPIVVPAEWWLRERVAEAKTKGESGG